MQNVACYKTLTELETDKKINIVYGLNGSGKSTLSNFLYNRSNPIFQDCSIGGLADEEILVYNQRFINDYFYTSESLPGIFTLSRENKESKEAISIIGSEIAELESDKSKKEESIGHKFKETQKNKDGIEMRIWNIKREYAGGDRVLGYCLRGLMGSKERLLAHLISVY
jgi:AAA15 family ATPase/GTPase